MLKSDLSIDAVNALLKNKNYSTLAKHIDERFKVKRNEMGQPIVPIFSEELIISLFQILNHALPGILDTNRQTLLLSVCKALRIYAINENVKMFLTKESTYLTQIRSVLQELRALPLLNIIGTIFQLLNNLTVFNRPGSREIYNTFQYDIFLCMKNGICVYEVSALIYNLSLFIKIDYDIAIYNDILNSYQNFHNEYLEFLLEDFLKSEDFWCQYQNLEIKTRLVVLEQILEKQLTGNLDMNDIGIKSFVNCFLKSEHLILQCALNTDADLDVIEVSHLLEIISSFSSNESKLQIFQIDKNFLIHCAALLLNVHRLGKHNDNCFTPIQNLKELKEPNSEIAKNPVFGFKGNLIRVIGNLTWKSQAREAEVIPVILDCCNIDARNPFITQWAIFAIRNLCEKNSENQKIIAGLHKQGEVTSDALKEMGLTIHTDKENSLKIVSLDALNSCK